MREKRKDSLPKKLILLERLFKACADRTRLRLLHMMATEGEICVRHFVEVLQTNQPKVSRHLAYLKRAGLVNDRKAGLWVHYSLATPDHQSIANILDCITAFCYEDAEAQEDLLTLRQLQTKTQNIRIENDNKPKVKSKETETARNEIQIELL